MNPQTVTKKTKLVFAELINKCKNSKNALKQTLFLEKITMLDTVF